MSFRGSPAFVFVLIGIALPAAVLAQTPAPAQSPAPPSSSSSSAKHVKKPAAPNASDIEAGAVINGVYRNKALAVTCKVPDGWVLRTDEMNAREDTNDSGQASATAPSATSTGGKVLLASFSRPPEAKAEDVNASIVIAAESVAAYPGLTDAAQYFGPLTEVAKAQGFTVDEEPYEFEIGTKKLVRGDFHKNVGTRVMLQSSLAMLAHGYVVSMTVIGGTEDEVEELIDGLSFGAAGK
jgi:hypothetical protein